MAATSSRSGMPARIVRKSVGPRSRPSALRQIVISRDSCRAECMARGVSFRGGGKPPELRLSSAALPLRVKWSTAFRPASAEELKAAHLLVLNAPDDGFLDGREARASGLSVVGWVGKFRRAEALVITCFGKLTGTVTDIKSGAQLRFHDYVQGERGLQFQRGGHWLPAIEIVCWEDRSGTHHSALCSDVRFVVHDDGEATLTIDGERQDI